MDPIRSLRFAARNRVVTPRYRIDPLVEVHHHRISLSNIPIEKAFHVTVCTKRLDDMSDTAQFSPRKEKTNNLHMESKINF
jgi:hypothetical protein